jgi:hypothetical protein
VYTSRLGSTEWPRKAPFATFGDRFATGWHPPVPQVPARNERSYDPAGLTVFVIAGISGHGSDEMVKRVYAHLGDVRHRSDVVEYHVEQHIDRLGDRLQ